MQTKDFGKGIKETLHGAADAVRDKVREIDTDEIKENIHGAAAAVKDKVAQAGDKAAGQVKKMLHREDGTQEDPEPELSAVSAKGALKMIYYLMAADGEIFHGEEEKFDAIGRELMSDFDKIKDDIINECKANLDAAANKEEYAAALQKGVDAAALDDGTDREVVSRLLVWDMMTVAYSDESCDESEQALIDYVAEKFGVDKAMCLQMQSSILTVLDLERELTWIKTTDRPYLTIEAHVNEINERKMTVMESVTALLSL